jgi:hypothetical protein
MGNQPRLYAVFYSNQSVSHVPDVDINFGVGGVGDRAQLTYKNAWLCLHNPGAATKFGMGQSQSGRQKWRFYDTGETGLAVSVFPPALPQPSERRSSPWDQSRQ